MKQLTIGILVHVFGVEICLNAMVRNFMNWYTFHKNYIYIYILYIYIIIYIYIYIYIIYIYIKLYIYIYIYI